MVEVAGHYLFIPVVRVLSFINREGVKEGSETGKGVGERKRGRSCTERVSFTSLLMHQHGVRP